MPEHADSDAPENYRPELYWTFRQKNPNHPCPTDGCPGDARYAPPGRGHDEGCAGPLSRPGEPS